MRKEASNPLWVGAFQFGSHKGVVWRCRAREISISFNWRDEKAFFGTESAPAAGVTGSRKRQHGRLLGLDVLTG
jgi:hypothetical protein